jgi:hypothetical protein
VKQTLNEYECHLNDEPHALSSCLCGKPRPQPPVRRQRPSEIIAPGLARLAGAQTSRSGAAPASIRPKRRPDPIARPSWPAAAGRAPAGPVTGQLRPHAQRPAPALTGGPAQWIVTCCRCGQQVTDHPAISAASTAPSSQQARRSSWPGGPVTQTGGWIARHRSPVVIICTARTAPVVSMPPCTYRP